MVWQAVLQMLLLSAVAFAILHRRQLEAGLKPWTRGRSGTPLA